MWNSIVTVPDHYLYIYFECGSGQRMSHYGYIDIQPAGVPDGETQTCKVYFISWTASSEFGTYRLCEQRRFRRACASAQSRQNLRCSLIQAVSQEDPSDRKPDPWPL